MSTNGERPHILTVRIYVTSLNGFFHEDYPLEETFSGFWKDDEEWPILQDSIVKMMQSVNAEAQRIRVACAWDGKERPAFEYYYRAGGREGFYIPRDWDM